ncbi:hypothetical protein BC832DRAFT_539220 [Gaertneriomyces semiglobifer]|nr:hypothetical protein BC832DRAFT_539220 [Gaertneriomyces semiglobifer]
MAQYEVKIEVWETATTVAGKAGALHTAELSSWVVQRPGWWLEIPSKAKKAGGGGHPPRRYSRGRPQLASWRLSMEFSACLLETWELGLSGRHGAPAACTVQQHTKGTYNNINRDVTGLACPPFGTLKSDPFGFQNVTRVGFWESWVATSWT